MKKLESLENFKKNQLSVSHLGKITGGDNSGGGSACLDGGSGTGCYSYSSDFTYTNAYGNEITHYSNMEESDDFSTDPSTPGSPTPLPAKFG
ncbi:MAG: hypothetical protein K0B10_14800 [Vicingaceae bacterium]|nr:hypothetical protein [Vicingaceae bacterium]